MPSETTETTIKTLATEMSAAFVERQRYDGIHPTTKFRCLKDGSPEWMTEVCHTAHGEMMPDDQRYAMIEEAVDAIAECDDIDDARDSLEADIYTHDLTAWLGSRTDRYSYADDAMEEWGSDVKGIIQLLQLGQLAEKHEVFDLVVSALESELASREEDDNTDPGLDDDLDDLDDEDDMDSRDEIPEDDQRDD